MVVDCIARYLVMLNKKLLHIRCYCIVPANSMITQGFLSYRLLQYFIWEKVRIFYFSICVFFCQVRSCEPLSPSPSPSPLSLSLSIYLYLSLSLSLLPPLSLIWKSPLCDANMYSQFRRGSESVSIIGGRIKYWNISKPRCFFLTEGVQNQVEGKIGIRNCDVRAGLRGH